MAPATRNRQRIGWTMRRTRNAAAVPLQVIQENTLMDLPTSSSSAASHFSQSPSKLAVSEIVKPSKSTLQHKAKEKGKQRQKRDDAAKENADANASRPISASRKRKATEDARAKEAGMTMDEKKAQTMNMLDELEKQLKKRQADILADAERMAEELRMELKVQLMFLPESVRRMPWKTFIEDYGGSIDNVIQTVKEQDYLQYLSSSQSSQSQSQSQSQDPASPPSALRIRTAPATVRSKEKRRSKSPGFKVPDLSTGLTTPSANTRASESAFQTPLWTPMQHEEPRTVMRTARKGETTYSARGSPIIPDTVVKAPRGSLVAMFNDDYTDPVASLTLDDDISVDLSNPDTLSEEYKAQAAIKLQALQAKVSAMLQRLK